MKVKGTIKNAGGKPNFWGKYEREVPETMKEVIYNQYYSHETIYIYIYCDCSMDKEKNMMAIASSYIQDGFITVKSTVIYPPNDCLGKNIYGELHAVISCLNNFEKYMNNFIKRIVIFSDVNDIIKIINQQVTFRKVSSLKKLQNKLIQLFENKLIENPSLTIKYLPTELKSHNPFLKSAHNAARKMLQKKV